jgi:TPR repeat protein
LTRTGGTFAVLIGVIVGVSAALARRSDAPAPAAPAALEAEPARQREPTPSPPIAPEPAPALTATASGAPTPSATSASATSASATSAPPTSAAPVATPWKPRVPLSPPVASADELKASEVRCYEQDPLACRRAFQAYEDGRVVPRDAERARTYQKVQVTQLVRQCENNKPLACLMLADLHDTGEGVTADARRAKRLDDHAHDICRRRPKEPGCPLPAR